MRLDKYLKVSRLIKRRTVANEACDAGRVTANGRPVKASYDVKVGDILEIKFGEKTVKLEVLVVAGERGQGRRRRHVPGGTVTFWSANGTDLPYTSREDGYGRSL